VSYEYINCKHGTCVICDVCNPPMTPHTDITASHHHNNEFSAEANPDASRKWTNARPNSRTMKRRN
jgi:hypothetical protein